MTDSHGRRPGLEVTEDLSRRPKAGTGDLSRGRRPGPEGTEDLIISASAAYVSPKWLNTC